MFLFISIHPFNGAEMNDYKNDINLDQHALDYELIRQPNIYLKYSEMSVDAGFVKDKAKEKLKLIESEVYLKIKKDYSEFGLDSKPTEGAIKACVAIQPECKKATINYFEAVKIYNSLNGAKVALEHKKKSLELLTGLIIRGYSAEPRVEKEFKDDSQKESHRVLNGKLANNKRLLKKKK